MRRAARAFLAAALLTALLPTPASATIPQAITWRVDHAVKTITITVRLTLYPACSEAKGVCEIDDIMVKTIREDILKVWNAGYSYRCYKILFEVDIEVDNGANRFTEFGDRVAVRIDQTAGTDFTNFVNGVGGGAWNSESPSDKHVPANDFLTPTTWAFPGTVTHVFAHEFGHILGMIDTYTRDDGENVPIPGAPLDIMSTDAGTVDQVTIDLLVKRSGVVKDPDLQCDIKIDRTIQGYTYKGTKCDPPTGEWKLAVTGAQPGMTWEGTVTAHLNERLTGPYEMALTWKVPNLGAGGDRFKGTASFDPGTAVSSPSGPSPELRLGPFSGEVWIAGAGVSVGSGGFTLPATYGDFC